MVKMTAFQGLKCLNLISHKIQVAKVIKYVVENAQNDSKWPKMTQNVEKFTLAGPS